MLRFIIGLGVGVVVTWALFGVAAATPCCRRPSRRSQLCATVLGVGVLVCACIVAVQVHIVLSEAHAAVNAEHQLVAAIDEKIDDCDGFDQIRDLVDTEVKKYSLDEIDSATKSVTPTTAVVILAFSTILPAAGFIAAPWLWPIFSTAACALTALLGVATTTFLVLAVVTGYVCSYRDDLPDDLEYIVNADLPTTVPPWLSEDVYLELKTTITENGAVCASPALMKWLEPGPLSSEWNTVNTALCGVMRPTTATAVALSLCGVCAIIYNLCAPQRQKIEYLIG